MADVAVLGVRLGYPDLDCPLLRAADERQLDRESGLAQDLVERVDIVHGPAPGRDQQVALGDAGRLGG